MSILELLDTFSFSEILSYTDSRTESLLAHTNKYFERFYVPCHLSKLDKYTLIDITSYLDDNDSRHAMRITNTRFKYLIHVLFFHALNYNLLKIMEGMRGLRYAN
jgi:hypothetical protein